MHVLRVHVHLAVREVPALGYKTLVVRSQEQIHRSDERLSPAAQVLENDFLAVSIQANGSLDILHKESGRIFKGLHYFEDSGEAGHAWRHVPPAFDQVLTTLHMPARIERLQSGPLLIQYAITQVLEVPEHLQEGQGDYVRRLDAEGDDARRSSQTSQVTIRSMLTLRQNDRGVEVQTTIVNTCRDHRLRAMFPTWLSTATDSCAEEPFDVVSRPIDRGAESPWRGTWNPTHPHQRFVDVSDGRLGLAILNDGLREYEVTDDATRTIGLTLLRAFEISLTTVAWRWERHPEMPLSQMPGEHTFRYYIYPHAGDWDQGQVVRHAEQFTVPLEIAQAGPHGGNLPQSLSFFHLDTADLQLCALKQAEDKQGIIVRISNPTNREITACLSCYQAPSQVQQTTLAEVPLPSSTVAQCGKQISFVAGRKKIVSLKIIF